MPEIVGLFAGVLGLAAYVPYIRDIVRGETRPDRASWLIWSLEYAALFVAQLAKGATPALWLIGLQFIGVLIVFLLALPRGVGGVERRNVVTVLAVCAVLPAWYLSRNASVAIILLILIELAAVVLTMAKVYRAPDSETRGTWAMIGLAGLISIAAVGDGAAILYIYPVSLALMCFGVVAASLVGARRRLMEFSEQ